MTQPAKVQEPSMEEILASIRRIIADDDAGKPAVAEAPKPVAPPAPPVAAAPVRAAPPRPAAPPPAPALNQKDIDAVLADLDSPAAKPAKMEADVLDLTEAMAAPAPAPSFRTIDGQSDVIFSDRPIASAPEPASRVVEEARKQFAQLPDRSLMSPSTSSSVDSAFNSLATTILGQNARTLEDLVKEMMRPMLKGWLDDNLPSLVERIVRAEIERVSRGR